MCGSCDHVCGSCDHVCVDHVTADKLASYILQGVLHPPVISWPVHLLLHILNDIVHASHGNKPVLTLTLLVLLLY